MNQSLQSIIQALDPRPMVQVVIITAGGQKYALLGPVIEDREDVTEIEFGDLIPMQVAAKMLSGDHREWLGTDLQ
jgi:hypothetical protein